MFDFVKITTPNYEDAPSYMPTTLVVDGNNITFSVTLTETDIITKSIDCSVFEVGSGCAVYVDKVNKKFELLPWGDRDYLSFVTIAYIVNSGEVFTVGLLEKVDTPTLDISVICSHQFTNNRDFRIYAYSFPTINKAKQINTAKYKTVYSNLDIYTSAAQLETQLDLVTKILAEIIKNDSTLEAKYGNDLSAILQVGVEYFGAIDINDLISDKKKVRDLQIEYFKLRTEINAGNFIPVL